jgi:hypothetical protein
VKAGLADPYCGPKIVHENADRIVAMEDDDFSWITNVFFDKKRYTMTMTQLSEGEYLSSSVLYLECH